MGKIDSALIIGGGIVGLAIAFKLSQNGTRVTVIEKEYSWGEHQTGRNSGVIHAGPYYKPGSLKAGLCLEGRKLMMEFAREHSIPHLVTGKLIVASSSADHNRLLVIEKRAQDNNVEAEMLDKSGILDVEPSCDGISALHVKETGIIDYSAVAKELASLLIQNGAELILGSEVLTINQELNQVVVGHSLGVSRASIIVNAAGLYSDKIARMAGLSPTVRIFPFRGEYYELVEEKKNLVRGLIYPVPDPEVPFLGVHLTRTISGGVHAGPNAMLAFAREGYSWGDIDIKEVLSMGLYPGFAPFLVANRRFVASEVLRSLSKKRFAKDIARLVPEISEGDLVRSTSGVRAQSLTRKGELVDDFVIETTGRQVHILNAPSPAATAAFAIAKYVFDLISKID
jgi:(S)-2-hydroxyglutarate dehydrogenase